MDYTKKITQLLEYYPGGLNVDQIRSTLSVAGINVPNLEEIVSQVAVQKHDGDYKNPQMVLEKYKGHHPDPTKTKITWWKNTGIQIKQASDKEKFHHYGHFGLKIQCGTVRDMIENGYRKGFQCLSGGFFKCKDPKDPSKYVVRTASTFASQELYVLDIDEYHEGITCIQDAVDQNEFIRNNAFAVIESVTGKTEFEVDGEMKPGVKFRIFFLLPGSQAFYPPYRSSRIFEIISVTRLATGLNVDQAGSNPTNGFMGRMGAEVIYLNNFVDIPTIAGFKSQLLEEQNQITKERRENIDFDENADIDKRYIDQQDQGNLPCPFIEHEHDGWELVGTSGKNSTTVYFNHDHISLYCHKCKHGINYDYDGKRIKYKKNSKSNPEPPTYDQMPSWNSWTPELIQLSESIGIPINATFTEDGEPKISIDPKKNWKGFDEHKFPKRRLYYKEFSTCSHCNKAEMIKCIDLQEKATYKYCIGCKTDERVDTFLLQELRRSATNHVHVSIEDGYLSDNEEFQNLDLWKPGHITHIASPVRVGKSTAIALRQKELASEGFKGIIANPRTALVEAQAPSLNRFCEDSNAYGQFHGNAHIDNKFIGSVGALCTISSLDKVFDEVHYSSKILLAIDEVDFSWDLLNTITNKSKSVSIKNRIKKLIEEQGIVLMGQTENYLNLEALCLELGIDPNTNLTVFSNEVQPLGIKATIKNVESDNSIKKAVVGLTIQDSIHDLKDGKTVLIFASGRVDCKVIAQELKPYLDEGEEPLVYTKYTKYGSRQRNFLKNGYLTDTRLLVASPAIDVGVSIQQEDAVTRIAVSQNPKFASGVHSIYQKTARNRRKGDIFIYNPAFQNAIPVSVSDSEFFKQKYAETISPEQADSDKFITLRHARFESLNEISAEQSIDYYKYNLEIAGYSIETETDKSFSVKDLEDLKVVYHEIYEDERQFVDMAKSIIINNEVLTSYELQRRMKENKLDQIPQEPMAHELAIDALKCVGWDGTPNTLDLITDDQRKIASEFCDISSDYKSTIKKIYGYLAVHYPTYIDTYMDKQIKDLEEKYQSIDRVINYRLTNMLTRTLLEKIGRNPISESDLQKVLSKVFNIRYNGRPLSDLAKKGDFGSTIAKKVRFLKLGTKSRFGDIEMQFIKEFLSDHYSVNLKRFNGTYKLHYDSEFETIAQLAEEFRQQKELFEEVDHKSIQKTGTDLIDPRDWNEIYSHKIDQANKMKADGIPMTQIEKQIGLPKWFLREYCQKTVKGESVKKQAIELRYKGKSASEISRTLKISDNMARKYVANITIKDIILHLIKGGNNTINLMISNSSLKKTTLRKHLKGMVDDKLIRTSGSTNPIKYFTGE